MKAKIELDVLSLIRDFEEMRDKIADDQESFRGENAEAMRVASILTLNNVIDHLRNKARLSIQKKVI
jgi:hypothetical protein